MKEIKEAISNGFRFIDKSFSFVALYTLIQFPYQYLQHLPKNPDKPMQSLGINIIAIAFLIISAIFSAGIPAAVRDAYESKVIRLKNLFSLGCTYFWRLVWVGLIFSLIALAVIAINLIIFMLIPTHTAATNLIYFMMIVPNLVALYYILPAASISSFPVVLEDVTGGDAVAKSFKLTKSHSSKLSILAIVLFGAIMTILAAILLYMLTYFLYGEGSTDVFVASFLGSVYSVFTISALLTYYYNLQRSHVNENFRADT